jgi:hypothetical protein
MLSKPITDLIPRVFLHFDPKIIKIELFLKELEQNENSNETFGTPCILYYTILYYTILYYAILFDSILYYTILYYTILYHTILHYTMIYHRSC